MSKHSGLLVRHFTLLCLVHTLPITLLVVHPSGWGFGLDRFEANPMDTWDVVFALLCVSWHVFSKGPGEVFMIDPN